MSEPYEMTDRDRALLQFEGTWWSLDGAKEAMIRATFACDLDEYYLELNRLIEIPAALAHDPLVVRRLLRQRDRRRRSRLDSPAQTDDAFEGSNV